MLILESGLIIRVGLYSGGRMGSYSGVGSYLGWAYTPSLALASREQKP